MAQLLIYEQTVPLTHQRHGKWHIQGGGDLAFAAHINAVPLTAVEFSPASDDYVIVFAGNEQGVMPTAVLGLRNKENLYLNAQNKWSVPYVPAFVRRYPFVFSSAADGKTFTVCIDEAFKGFNAEGKGEALFGADAKPTKYTEGVLKFLQEYQTQFFRTQAFCKRLVELKLLSPMQAEVTSPAGEKTSLGGFLAVDRNKLMEVPADTLQAMLKSGELDLIFMHLHSLRNFNELKDRFVARQPAAAAKPAAASA